jgi:photosystem II stability/assembly factor-like uncharacterized protein
MRFIEVAGALALAGISAGAWAGPGVWTTAGPEGGDASHLVASPTAADTLIAATRGGIFRSTDAGASWQRFEAGVAYAFPYALEMASTADAAYVGPNATTLFRSAAGGNWMPTALSLASSDYLVDLSLRPGNGQFIVAVSATGIHLSSDSGATFAPAASTGLPTLDSIALIDYASVTRMYLAYASSGAVAPAVYRSNDGGATWAPTAALPSVSFLFSGDGDLETAPSDIDRVYFATGGTIFVSTNGGGSWTECGSGPVGSNRIEVEAGNPDRLWATGNSGIHSSINGCANWTPHTTGLSADGTRIDRTETLALAPGFPGDDRVWVGSAHGGVYRSSDAGATFAPVNAGLVSSNIRAIAMHPADANQILLGYGDAFTPSPTVYRSTDGGLTWPRSNTGMLATQLRGLAIDPTTAALPGGAHVYAVGSSRPGLGTIDASTTDGGIYKSIDGGASWSTIDNGLPTAYFGTRFVGTVRSVVLDRSSCLAPPASGPCVTGPLRTVYVTASGLADYAAGTYDAARIYKSIDAGATWTASETGLPAPVSTATCLINQIAVPLVIDPSAPSTLYVGMSLNNVGDPSCVPTIANGVFKSTDGGATWVHASNGLPRLAGAGSSQWSVLALAIDPAAPNTLYAGAYETVAGHFSGRIFKTIDGGANWSETSVGIAGQDVRALLIDPTDSNTIYAGTGGSLVDPSGVYRSTDGGLTWNSISIGLPADAATALAIDPHAPTRLLAGTPGGLWEMTQIADEDSDGASTAVENAAPGAGDADASGTPDAQESHVASFLGEPAAFARADAKGAPLPVITLKVEALEGDCSRINNAHALPGESLPADMARGVAPSLFDRGVLRFELPDCQRARVTVILHGADYDDVDWGWRNYGPLTPGDANSMAWYDFAGARKISTDTWELIVDSGERGNYRDDPSGILFVGAPGFVDIQLFGDSFE